MISTAFKRIMTGIYNKHQQIRPYHYRKISPHNFINFKWFTDTKLGFRQSGLQIIATILDETLRLFDETMRFADENALSYQKLYEIPIAGINARTSYFAENSAT